MKLDFSRPGFALSALGHGTILAALLLPLLWLSSPPADDDMPEAVPIETISQTDFNQIMKGEKTSKDVTKEPTTKADKVAQADEQHALPPNAELQKEVAPAAARRSRPPRRRPCPPPRSRRRPLRHRRPLPRRRSPSRRSGRTPRRRPRSRPKRRRRRNPWRSPRPPSLRPPRRCRRSATRTPRW